MDTSFHVDCSYSSLGSLLGNTDDDFSPLDNDSKRGSPSLHCDLSLIARGHHCSFIENIIKLYFIEYIVKLLGKLL